MAANEYISKTDWSMLVDRQAIGQGAFATVFKANHRKWGVVAYKLLANRGDMVEDETIKELEKEVSAHCQLRHPNIVQIMAMVYEPMVECGIVLWFEKYGNVGKFLRDFDVPLAWRIELIRHINLGMNYLHTHQPPVLHGDLKTLNILVGEGFVAKLSDFGMSVWKTYSSLRTRRTDARLEGTVTHIPPERLNDHTLRLHETADVYGFGILIWEILTGKHPYEGCQPALVHTSVINNQRPPVDQVPAGVPGGLKDCMQRCWSQQPENRPTTDELKITLAAMKMADALIAQAKFHLYQQESQLELGSRPVVPVECVSNAASVPAVDQSPGSNRTGSAVPVPCSSSAEVVDVPVATTNEGTGSEAQRDDDDDDDIRLEQMSLSASQTLPARLLHRNQRQRAPLRNVISCDTGFTGSYFDIYSVNIDDATSS